MANLPPSGAPVESRDPSNRWPWVALILGLVIVLAAVGFFVLNRSQTVNINLEGTPTVNPVARASTVSPGPPPTLVPPTQPPSANLAPSATPLPAPTATKAPPTPTPAPPTQAQAPPAGAQPNPAAPGGAQPNPAAPGGAQPNPAPPQNPAPAPAAPPTPTPFAGQVASAGGMGNTRSDIDAAYGPPTGETPDNLVAYRKGAFEYHVGFAPDLNGRATLIVEIPQQNQPLPLDQAQTEAHKLLPRDAQPPNQTPEGNNQFAVERYTSQTLAQALSPDVFAARNAQPGQFMLVYVKDPQGRITRMIMGLGNDPNALINQGR